MLEDIAVPTGGQVISEDLGIKLENVSLDMLGRAKRCSIEKENTTIIEDVSDIVKSPAAPVVNAASKFIQIYAGPLQQFDCTDVAQRRDIKIRAASSSPGTPRAVNGPHLHCRQHPQSVLTTTSHWL